MALPPLFLFFSRYSLMGSVAGSTLSKRINLLMPTSCRLECFSVGGSSSSSGMSATWNRNEEERKSDTNLASPPERINGAVHRRSRSKITERSHHRHRRNSFCWLKGISHGATGRHLVIMTIGGQRGRHLVIGRRSLSTRRRVSRILKWIIFKSRENNSLRTVDGNTGEKVVRQ